MAQLKSHEADRFVARPDLGYAVYLIYGPDHGLAAERARRLAKATGVPLDDPFSAIRIDGPSASADPDRLINEAYTVAMFGGRRLIWLRDAGNDRALVGQVERLLSDPPPETTVLVEAGDLKKGTGLRGAVERAKTGMAIPCYADNDRAVQALIDQTFSDTGQKLALDARQFLLAHLGGDRAASRSELEKIVLYTRGHNAVTLDDVQAICGDASSLGYGDVNDAVLTGDLNALDRAMVKYDSGGGAPSVAFTMLSRQFQMLDRLRAQMDIEGKTAAATVAQAKPPIFFARRAAMETALRIWTPGAIRAALERLRDAVLQSRQTRHLERDILHITLMALTIQSARRR